MPRRRTLVREPATAYETKVDPNGRIVLPAPIRHELGLDPGAAVVVRVDADGIRVTSRAAALREAQELVRRHVKPATSLVGDLLRRRREEAAGG